MNKSKIVGIVVVVIVLMGLISLGSLAWRYMTAELKGRVGAEEQLESAPSRIANYEHFFDLCASIQRKEAKIIAQTDNLELAEADKERRRIRQNIAALKGARAGDIARYNADASKQYTRARFLSSDLPYRIDPRADRTTCTGE